MVSRGQIQRTSVETGTSSEISRKSTRPGIELEFCNSQKGWCYPSTSTLNKIAALSHFFAELISFLPNSINSSMHFNFASGRITLGNRFKNTILP